MTANESLKSARLYLTLAAGMMLALLFLLTVSACGPQQRSDTAYDGPPPPAYRGDVTATVHFVSDVAKSCQKAGLKDMGSDYEVNGCTIIKKGVDPIILLPNPCKAGDLRSTTCHEIGHANGWPGDHPA